MNSIYSYVTQKRQVVRSNPVLQRIEAVQRTTAATTPVIIGVGRKTPSNHTIQTLENTESVMIHSLHPKIPLFTTLPNINPSLSSILGTVVAKGLVICNGQIMTDSVFARGFIGQFEGVLLTTPTNTDSIGPMVHYTASARYHTGFQRTTCRV